MTEGASVETGFVVVERIDSESGLRREPDSMRRENELVPRHLFAATMTGCTPRSLLHPSLLKKWDLIVAV